MLQKVLLLQLLERLFRLLLLYKVVYNACLVSQLPSLLCSEKLESGQPVLALTILVHVECRYRRVSKLVDFELCFQSTLVEFCRSESRFPLTHLLFGPFDKVPCSTVSFC